MDLEQGIIDVIRKEVASSERASLFREPIVGFSAADDPLYDEIRAVVGEHHLHPRDILTDAKSVISFFVPFSREVVESNREGDDPSLLWAESYDTLNRLLASVSGAVADHLREAGVAAATIPPTAAFDRVTLACAWSHRSAAFVAGLGRFGLNHMLITPRGGAGRYGSAITAAALTPGQRSSEEPCLYFRNGGCRVCEKQCPAHALSPESMDKQRCFARCIENSRRFPQYDDCEVCGKCVVAGPCAYVE